VEVLDPALFRRFDDVIRYGLPTADAAEELIRNALNVFSLNGDDWTEVRRACDGLSYAEIARACTEPSKAAILTDRGVRRTNENLYTHVATRPFGPQHLPRKCRKSWNLGGSFYVVRFIERRDHGSPVRFQQDRLLLLVDRASGGVQ
jgi:SpoVK/Ycf46/Vps4 family AAA+-type ATPase